MRKSTVTMKRILLTALLVLVVVLAGCANKPAPAIAKTAESIVDSIAKGDFASATTDFNAVMKSQLPADKLGQVWTQLTAQIGPFNERLGTREAREQGYNMVFVTCRFEKGNMDFKVVFDNSNQVTGLFVVPSQSAPEVK